jgi:hypothetical protein
MSYRRKWIAVTVVILGLSMFGPVAQAQRQDVEFILCGATTWNVVESTLEVGIGSYDAKGIIHSTHESGLFDNWTVHLIGVEKWMGSEGNWNTLSKRMGPDGDFIIWESYGDSENGSTLKPVYGTGKWKGIKGEFKIKQLRIGKPNIQFTDQFCEKHVGWIELPK